MFDLRYRIIDISDKASDGNYQEFYEIAHDSDEIEGLKEYMESLKIKQEI